MPPETKCPFCEKIVPDWHFEWHAQQDQGDIFAGNKLMECPVCWAGVAFDGFSVTKSDSQGPIAKRDVRKAARWARKQNKSLRDYLQTREGDAYTKGWTAAEIDAADNQAAADTE
jgi:hypothetical protein